MAGLAVLSKMPKIKVPREVIRGIQAMFSIVVLVLSAYVANWYNTDTLTSSPTQVNIMIFAGILSIVSLLVLEVLPKLFPRLSHPWEFVFIEFTNVVFWFGSGTSLSVFLSRLLFCRGSVCAAARVDAVFAFVLFGAWLGTFIPLVLDVFKSGFRKPSPKMSGAVGMKEVA